MQHQYVATDFPTKFEVPTGAVANAIAAQTLDIAGRAIYRLSTNAAARISSTNLAELSRLTMARDKSLTAKGLMLTRRQFFQGSQGLTLVDTAQPFYEPPQFLKDWIAREKQFFFTAPDPRMMPRGLLFDGLPGLGKSAGAKYVAEQFGIPLYRLDIGTTKNKFVGESEGNLSINLQRLDQEEPCVCMFDNCAPSSVVEVSGA